MPQLSLKYLLAHQEYFSLKLDKSLEDKENVIFSGVTLDSREVEKDYIFIAATGATQNSQDGRKFVDKAKKNGAALIISKSNSKNPRISAAKLAEAFYNFPSKKLKIFGVTGTNGKSTVCSFAAQLTDNSAVIGTLGYGEPNNLKPTGFTTPEAENLSKILFEFSSQNIKNIFLEVSSHAISTHRIDGINFSGSLLTNLSQDHLDFHETLERYHQTKKNFIRDKKNKKIKNHFKAENIAYSKNKVSFDLIFKNNKNKVNTHANLLGTFNIKNILHACDLAYAVNGSKYNLEYLAEKIKILKTPAGRMQQINMPNKPLVIIDFAHTPDALKNLLEAVKLHANGQGSKLILVFGCGGNRDKDKRSQMGKIAVELADKVFVTSDNPRNEDPEEIIKDIAELHSPQQATELNLIPDRQEAIETAIRLATPDDIVIIAGKGHEKFQITGNKKIPFDDFEIAKSMLGDT